MEQLCAEVRNAFYDANGGQSYDRTFAKMFPDCNPATTVLTPSDMILLLARLGMISSKFKVKPYIKYARGIKNDNLARELTQIATVLPTNSTAAKDEPAPDSADVNVVGDSVPADQLSVWLDERYKQHEMDYKRWAESLELENYEVEPTINCYLAHCGHLHILVAAHNLNKISKPYGLLKYAIIAGQLHVVKWARTEGYEIDPIVACGYAAKHGQCKVFKYIVTNTKACRGIMFGDNSACVLRAVGIGGSVDIVSWLLVIGAITPANRHFLIKHAALHGHHEVLKKLGNENTLHLTHDDVKGAAANGHLSVVQLACVRDRAAVGDISELMEAAKDHAHIVEWLELAVYSPRIVC